MGQRTAHMHVLQTKMAQDNLLQGSAQLLQAESLSDVGIQQLQFGSNHADYVAPETIQV